MNIFIYKIDYDECTSTLVSQNISDWVVQKIMRVLGESSLLYTMWGDPLHQYLSIIVE